MQALCVLANRIVFVGLGGYNYTSILIKDAEIQVKDINYISAKKLIKKLNKVKDCELGKIYTDDNFEELLRENPSLKNAIYCNLEQLDDVL